MNIFQEDILPFLSPQVFLVSLLYSRYTNIIPKLVIGFLVQDRLIDLPHIAKGM